MYLSVLPQLYGTDIGPKAGVSGWEDVEQYARKVVQLYTEIAKIVPTQQCSAVKSRMCNVLGLWECYLGEGGP
jgi:hypothetical protein